MRALPTRLISLVALAATLGLVAAVCAPLASLAVHDDDPRCCRSGVCCHYRKPADSECVRAACRCAGHDGSNALSLPYDWMQARLAAAVVAPVPSAFFTPLVAHSERWPDAPHAPPDHPPRVNSSPAVA
jgi:hypothetical protein